MNIKLSKYTKKNIGHPFLEQIIIERMLIKLFQLEEEFYLQKEVMHNTYL